MLLRPSLLVFGVLALNVSGCGVRVDTDKDSDRDVQQTTADAAFAEQYFVDDLECMKGDGGVVTRAPVHMWQGDSSRPINYTFNDTSARASLRGPSISESYYGLHQRAACTVEGGEVVCDGKATLEQEPKALKLCRPEGPYERASVEGVALASYANLATAYEFYVSLPDHSPTLLKSRMLVLPTIEKVYEQNGVTKRSVSTDNLAYTPEFAGQPAFIIYPKGRRAKQDGLWEGLNLWELPWAMAHEYGHHIFRTHTGVTSLGDEEGAKSINAPLPIQSFDDENTSGLRSVSGTEYWGATNEGYADLFSYYTFGAEAGLVKGVDCFDQNRATESGSFANGDLKRLDDEIMNVFMSSTKAERSEGCKNPYYQDIHAIGAIIAYGVNRLFDTAVKADQGAAAAPAKAALLLAWAERLGAVAKATAAANLNFDLILSEALQVTTDAGATRADVCAVMQDVFPAINVGC